jgi:hypothetical protein
LTYKTFNFYLMQREGTLIANKKCPNKNSHLSSFALESRIWALLCKLNGNNVRLFFSAFLKKNRFICHFFVRRPSVVLKNFWTLASTELYNSSLGRSWRVEVCNAEGHAEKWSGKEMVAQNVKHIDNCEIFIKKSIINIFLLPDKRNENLTTFEIPPV